MTENFETYESIRDWKDSHILHYQTDTIALNDFHDTVMKHVFSLALEKLNKGNPPCLFAWFITGSGGRFEQGLISDQDHGFVFEDETKETARFFRELGEELSFGLSVVGYPYCEGKVMPSNPLWCRSVYEWKRQLLQWMEEETLETIRCLQIYYDARILLGQNQFVQELKTYLYDYQREEMKLLTRFLDNVMLIKKAIGPFGQIMVEEKGKHEGSVDLKHAAFIPYVNAVRLLAIKEGIYETSTVGRLQILITEKGYPLQLKTYQSNFVRLLELRNNSYRQGQSYIEAQYLSINMLDKASKKELKNILKGGLRLHRFVQERILTKGC